MGRLAIERDVPFQLWLGLSRVWTMFNVSGCLRVSSSNSWRRRMSRSSTFANMSVNFVLLFLSASAYSRICNMGVLNRKGTWDGELSEATIHRTCRCLRQSCRPLRIRSLDQGKGRTTVETRHLHMHGNIDEPLYSNLGMGPLTASLSPGFIWCMYLDIFPASYFLTRKTSSPCASEGEIGVYGRMTGSPLASFKGEGESSGDLTMTQEATGRRDTWFPGSSKVSLSNELRWDWDGLWRGKSALGGVVVVRLNILERKLYKLLRIKRTFLLDGVRSDLLKSVKTAVEVDISSEAE